MIIIRDLRGCWPNWFATMDTSGNTVYVRIRHGEARIGTGVSDDAAEQSSVVIKESPDYEGVTDVVDALVLLRERGFYYVCPVKL